MKLLGNLKMLKTLFYFQQQVSQTKQNDFVLKKLFKTSEQLCNMFLKRVAANEHGFMQVRQ